jgi:hypothetical protein
MIVVLACGVPDDPVCALVALFDSGVEDMSSAAIGGTYVLTEDGARQIADMVDTNSSASPSADFESRYVESGSDRLTALQNLVRAHRQK